MRFAGSAITSYAGTPGMESFLDPNRPDSGEIAMMGDKIRASEAVKGIGLQGQTQSKGIAAAGAVEAAKINAQGQQALANAQGNAAMMGAIGDIASAGIGAFDTPKIPQVGTVARADHDIKYLKGLDQSGWAGIAQGLIP